MGKCSQATPSRTTYGMTTAACVSTNSAVSRAPSVRESRKRVFNTAAAQTAVVGGMARGDCLQCAAGALIPCCPSMRADFQKQWGCWCLTGIQEYLSVRQPKLFPCMILERSIFFKYLYFKKNKAAAPVSSITYLQKGWFQQWTMELPMLPPSLCSQKLWMWFSCLTRDGLQLFLPYPPTPQTAANQSPAFIPVCAG